MPAGRPKGSLAKTPAAKAFVERIDRQLRREGYANGLESFAIKFIKGEDTKTAFGVWRTLINYKLGMPKETVEATVNVSFTETLQRIRERKRAQA